MRQLSTQHIVSKATLYSVVFGSRLMRGVVGVMFVFFVMHPIVPAFASEELPEVEIETTEVAEEVVDEVIEETENVDSVIEEVIPVEDTVDSEVQETLPKQTLEESSASGTDTSVETDSEEAVVDMNTDWEETSDSGETADVSDSTDTDVQDVSDIITASSSTTEDGVTEVADAEENSSTTNSTEITPEPLVEGVSTTTQEGGGEIEDEVADMTESAEVLTNVETSPKKNVVVDDSEMDEEDMTIPAPEYFEVSNVLTHTDAHYQFQKTQCVSMGDGGYYCAEKQLMNPEVVKEDRLYTALDTDGDLEIYLQNNGKVQQITDNEYDDAAPYYDAISDSIVWHRLIKGRYQIMNFEGGEEVQITDSRNNSMEPKRSGDYITWQEWIGDNWEVMFFNGVETLQITNTGAHDIAPYVQGGYIIWTTTDGQESSVSVYDIQTTLVSSIDDTEGGRVENPRFVLVYDKKFENGDVVTKGFNPETGEVTPLSAQPASVPNRLPSSDSTGETRALIQNKSTSREDFANEITPETASSSDSSSASSAEVTSTGEELPPSLDLTLSSSSEPLVLTDFDIIVEPFSTTSSAQDDGSTTTIETVE